MHLPPITRGRAGRRNELKGTSWKCPAYRRCSDSLARLQPDPQAYVRAIASTAGDIEKIGDTIHDGQFRQFQLQRGLATSGRQLRAACD